MRKPNPRPTRSPTLHESSAIENIDGNRPVGIRPNVKSDSTPIPGFVGVLNGIGERFANRRQDVVRRIAGNPDYG
jgi:hypothetical protein